MAVQERDDAQAEEMAITDAIQFERDMMDCAELDAYMDKAIKDNDNATFRSLANEACAIDAKWRRYLGRRLRRGMEHARWWHMKRQRELCLYSECNPWWKQEGRGYDPDLIDGPLLDWKGHSHECL